MKEFITYQLEVACCLALFYLFYLLILRKETNFSVKRIYFIVSGILAFILPALHIQFSINAREIPVEYINILPAQFIDYTPPTTQPNNVDPWIWITLLWGSGCTIMLLRLFFSLSNIGKILRETTNCPDGQTFKITNAKVQSFSFFKTIVLNAHHYQSKAMKYILAHERAHSDQYHSVDVLLLELLKTIQWFNPCAWLLGKASLQNLEYLADKEVAETLINKQEYQIAIVQFSHQHGRQLLRSEFSKSNLKKRIIMMNQKTQKISAVKFMLLLPLLAILFMSFSIKFENLDLRKEVSDFIPAIISPEPENNDVFNMPSPKKLQFEKTLISIQNTTSADSLAGSIEEVIIPIDSKASDDKAADVFTIVEDQPTPSTGDIISYYEEINKGLKYPKKAKKNNITGKVFVQFIVQKDGTLREVKAAKGLGYGCDEEAVRIIKNGPLWNAGKLKGTKVDVRMILPVSFGISTKQTVQIKSSADSIKEVFTIVEDQPRPSTGDITSYYEIITSNLLYPKQAQKKGIKGKVFVQFIVQKDGILREVKAVKGLGYGCDEEAVRVVKEGPSWIAGKQRGRSVDVRMILPISFGIPHELKQNHQTRLIKGVVISEAGFPITGANVSVIGTSVGTVTDSNGKFTLKVNSLHKELIISSNGYSSQIHTISSKNNFKVRLLSHSGIKIRKAMPILDDTNPPLYLLGGKEISKEKMEEIDPSSIRSIKVHKSSQEIDKYGDKGKNGVIMITLKELNVPSPKSEYNNNYKLEKRVGKPLN